MRYHVKGFNRLGDLLLHTTHSTEISKDVEVSVWKERIATKGDAAAYFEVSASEDDAEEQP